MDVTKPYKSIGFGAMDATKPYKFIVFGAIDATKPYKFTRSGARDLAFQFPRAGFEAEPGSPKFRGMPGPWKPLF